MSDARTPIPSAGAILLCGGKSSRMGRPKALLPWRGRAMVAHVATVLSEVVDEVIVVTSEALDVGGVGLEALPGVEIVRDEQPELGPLLGVHAGLTALQSERAYVTSTDSPYLSAAFVRAVLEHDAAEYGGAAAVEHDGFVQPLAAVVPKSRHELAARLIEEDRRRPLFLLKEGDGFASLASAGLPDPESLHNFNTPDDYLAAVREASPDATMTVELFGVARSKAGVATLERPVGTVGEILQSIAAETGLALLRESQGGETVLRVAENYLVSLNGAQFMREAFAPIGPDERLLILDAAVGG